MLNKKAAFKPKAAVRRPAPKSGSGSGSGSQSAQRPPPAEQSKAPAPVAQQPSSSQPHPNLQPAASVSHDVCLAPVLASVDDRTAEPIAEEPLRRTSGP